MRNDLALNTGYHNGIFAKRNPILRNQFPVPVSLFSKCTISSHISGELGMKDFSKKGNPRTDPLLGARLQPGLPEVSLLLELDPSKQTIRDEVDAASSQFVENLKEEFAEYPEVLDILFAMECGIYSRKEITAQMKISHPIYDKAIKRLQRRAASRKGEFINSTR